MNLYLHFNPRPSHPLLFYQGAGWPLLCHQSEREATKGKPPPPSHKEYGICISRDELSSEMRKTRQDFMLPVSVIWVVFPSINQQMTRNVFLREILTGFEESLALEILYFLSVLCCKTQTSAFSNTILLPLVRSSGWNFSHV